MFQYFLLVFSTSLENSENNLLRIKRSPTKDKLDSLHEKNNEHYKTKAESFKKGFFPYERITDAKSKKSIKKTQKNKLQLLKNYVFNLRQLNSMLNVAAENIDPYSIRLLRFDELLHEWENEKLATKFDQIEIKLTEEQYDVFKKNYYYCINWLCNYRLILQNYLPKSKIEIAQSSMGEDYKQLIIASMNSIERAMRYYEKLNPKNITYKYHHKEMIFYGTLLSERFPYLFNHFDLGGRFINMYELIIKQFKKIDENDDNMITTLYMMPKKITFLIKHVATYLENTRKKLICLRTKINKVIY
ncbi:uncharacterized protein VNE69_09167 [Vairimorpha necatrix]|uniref:Uncharacterized protein n=1 Tax=Vairimorpha necatrix TaxID=6039 RepID=A0AAX4JF28_9MICR